ncbi:uncharacterized protein [Amphiura filiformis]|uniref:uncharacterized protein n=1 Tax=Amphiura filiformis TaxID=82378 RepID=UPI003B223EC0
MTVLFVLLFTVVHVSPSSNGNSSETSGTDYKANTTVPSMHSVTDRTASIQLNSSSLNDFKTFDIQSPISNSQYVYLATNSAQDFEISSTQKPDIKAATRTITTSLIEPSFTLNGIYKSVEFPSLSRTPGLSSVIEKTTLISNLRDIHRSSVISDHQSKDFFQTSKNNQSSKKSSHTLVSLFLTEDNSRTTTSSPSGYHQSEIGIFSSQIMPSKSTGADYEYIVATIYADENMTYLTPNLATSGTNNETEDEDANQPISPQDDIHGFIFTLRSNSSILIIMPCLVGLSILALVFSGIKRFFRFRRKTRVHKLNGLLRDRGYTITNLMAERYYTSGVKRFANNGNANVNKQSSSHKHNELQTEIPKLPTLSDTWRVNLIRTSSGSTGCCRHCTVCQTEQRLPMNLDSASTRL